jgi:hypothetical protein
VYFNLFSTDKFYNSCLVQFTLLILALFWNDYFICFIFLAAVASKEHTFSMNSITICIIYLSSYFTTSSGKNQNINHLIVLWQFWNRLHAWELLTNHWNGCLLRHFIHYGIARSILQTIVICQLSYMFIVVYLTKNVVYTIEMYAYPFCFILYVCIVII